MAKIIFLHSVLNDQNVSLINSIGRDLKSKDKELLLIGWDGKEDFDLYPQKIQLPVDLNHFKIIYKERSINRDFEEFGLNADELVDRFNWWFPKPEKKIDRLRRKSFLHFHLHLFLDLIKNNKPGLAMIWNGNDPRQFLLSKLCDYYGIKRLFLERGTLPSLWFYDVLGVLGHSTVSSLNIDSISNTSEQIELLDKYRAWYFNSTETLWEQPQRNEEIDIKRKFGIQSGQKVVLFVGQVDNDIQSKIFSPYFNSNKDAFEWFINYGKKEEDFVIGKHHPKSQVPVSHYREVIGSKENIVWTEELSLDEIIGLVDYVVAVNSSVIFDALMYKKPVLSLGNTMLDGKGILYEYNPDKINVISGFYDQAKLDGRVENFNKLFGFLLCNNFVYFNDDEATHTFSNKISNWCEPTEIKVPEKDSANIIDNYLLNVYQKNGINGKPYPSSLKKFIKRVLKGI